MRPEVEGYQPQLETLVGFIEGRMDGPTLDAALATEQMRTLLGVLEGHALLGVLPPWQFEKAQFAVKICWMLSGTPRMRTDSGGCSTASTSAAVISPIVTMPSLSTISRVGGSRPPSTRRAVSMIRPA